MGPASILNTRMWTFLFLYILAINFCQTAGDGNSTQMLYAKLIIDENAIPNITLMLKPFVSSANFYVETPLMTTQCKNAEKNKECKCNPGHRWSNTLCQSNPTCCGNMSCILGESANAMCILNTAVTIKGSLKLPNNDSYIDCLKSTDSDPYKKCLELVSTKMKTVFSTLRGFNYLDITGFRLGSIITDFVMSIVSGINSTVLITLSEEISKNLQASLDMSTSGVVHLIMPKMPVLYEATKQVITCKANEDLKVLPKWSITNTIGKYDITNGTVSTVTIVSQTESNIFLKEVTDLWAGEYLCLYHQTRSYEQGCSVNIFHKDSAKLDVALLPKIDVFTQPSFPRCINDQTVLEVTAKCEIKNSSEPYIVSWTGDSLKDNASQIGSDDILAYTVKKIMTCKGVNTDTGIVCTFQNRLGQKANSSVPFNIIQVNDKFCPANNVWEDTKAGFTAVVKCTNSAGLRQRKCNSLGKWQDEQSGCVNSDLYSVLQNAIISDTGLGLLNENAANVFHNLQNVTKTPETINSFANVNASVVVLSTMSGKLSHIVSLATVDALLTSSSNLLDESLGNSWATQNRDDNKTLAEKYLSSVENLISMSEITNGSIQENIQVATCSDKEQCTNSVFKTKVLVKRSGQGIVKTAAFQNLQNYFPSTTNTSDINSMIVSTTQDGKNNLEITLTFTLLQTRPPDVEMECVSWDYNNSCWSTHGCKWGGASNPYVCICNHLTSFAILMSRVPLKIPYITEITYAGLSVSVVSLIISLLIELIVWNKVVKTNTLYLRHTAHINISLCLLVADGCFLASSYPEGISQIWCRISALLKHFCYLAMFFWMLSLSTTLLHQAVFLFHKVGKKTYLRFSLFLGYVCPFLIVFITFLTNNAGEQGLYFSVKTCWLVYSGILKGTIYTFILPVGIIIFINLFSMVVVIMKLLDHKSSDKAHENEMRAAKTVLRSVILLTPIFGLPWIFGFATFSLDLTAGAVTLAVNYAFVILNAFQGLFIMLTTCLGDKMTREALVNSCRKKKAPATISESSTKLETKKT